MQKKGTFELCSPILFPQTSFMPTHCSLEQSWSYSEVFQLASKYLPADREERNPGSAPCDSCSGAGSGSGSASFMSSRGALYQFCSHNEVLGWGNWVGFWSPCAQSNTKRSRQTRETELFILVHVFDVFFAILFGRKCQHWKYREQLVRWDLTARAPADCLILCGILWVPDKSIHGVFRLTV